MPTVSISNSIAASTTNDNILSANLYEFTRADGYLSAGFTQSATGLLVSHSFGGRLVARDLVPLIKATTPIFPDDYLIQGEAFVAGERMITQVRNTTVGALTLLSVFKLDEVM